MSLLAQLLAVLIFVGAIWTYACKGPRPSRPSVAILVLGDIGRSPRMMYHAESFATHGFDTYLIGYKGSRPIQSLYKLDVRFLYLTEPPVALKRLPFLALAPIKVLLQITTILWTLLVSVYHPPQFIMVQNPPSIPTLALVWLVCRLRGCKLIIDWHNLGYSMLALRLGANHMFVKVAKLFEATFGRTAYLHLFVTEAMKDHLDVEWGLQGKKAILYDRPPAHFHRASAFETHDLLMRLRASISSPALQPFLPASAAPQSTPLTQLTPPSASSPPSNARLPTLRPDRPALLVSSTSWTPDEDFALLLAALQLYEKRAKTVNAPGVAKSCRLPKVLMVVTGKGPLKEKYMMEVARLEVAEAWEWVRCISLWLEAADYPLLLGSADLGICLHSSSSALDLPMKVVDMFGCGLPVCALDFLCLPELVKESQNGLIFRAAEQLAEQMETLLAGFPTPERLENLRQSLVANGTEWGTWTQNWDRVMGPLIMDDVGL